MPFLLDSSICSIPLKLGKGSPLFSRLIQYGGQLQVSRLTCAELYAYAFRNNAKVVDRLDDFLNGVYICDFDESSARKYGEVHARLAERGLTMESVDLMIAATAIVHDLLLVTHDRDFDVIAAAIPELQLIDWVN